MPSDALIPMRHRIDELIAELERRGRLCKEQNPEIVDNLFDFSFEEVKHTKKEVLGIIRAIIQSCTCPEQIWIVMKGLQQFMDDFIAENFADPKYEGDSEEARQVKLGLEYLFRDDLPGRDM